MFSSLTKILLNIKAKLDFFLASKALAMLGYKDISSDMSDKSIIFSFDEERVAILNMDHHMLGYSIEATIVYSADVLSLKTTSDINNLIYMYRCSSSGLRPATDNRVRLNLAYHIGPSLSLHSLRMGMEYLNKCLATLEIYLSERLRRVNREVYDLSMFEDVELTGFNPQDMGERKEFIFGSWDAYADAVNDEYSGFTNHPYAIESLAKIRACKEFEDINKVPVSELGLWLLEDIILNRQLSETSKTSYGIN